jgi:hypothetical protein
MRTSSPGPPGRASAALWRRWLFPAAIAAGLVTLLALPARARNHHRRPSPITGSPTAAGTTPTASSGNGYGY